MLWEQPFQACAIACHRCRLRLRRETGWAEFGYFFCYFKIVALRALVFRPPVKENKAPGTRLSIAYIMTEPNFFPSLPPLPPSIFFLPYLFSPFLPSCLLFFPPFTLSPFLPTPNSPSSVLCPCPSSSFPYFFHFLACSVKV